MRTDRVIAMVLLLLSAGTSRAAAAGDATSVDVSCVRPDHLLAVVIHPKRIAASSLVAAQLQDPLIAGGIKRLGISPDEIEEITFLFSLEEPIRGEPELITTIVVRFAHDVDAKEIFGKLQEVFKGPRAAKKITEIQVAGKTCFDPGGEPIAYAAAKNIIAFTSRQNIKSIVAGHAKGPLLDKLKDVAADSEVDFVCVNDSSALLDLFFDNVARGAAGPIKRYASAAKTVRSTSCVVKLTGPSLLRLSLETENAEAAGNIQDMLQESVRMCMGGLMVAKQTMPADVSKQFGSLLKLADQCLDGTKVTKSGTQVMLEVKRPGILDKGGAAILDSIKSFTSPESSAKNPDHPYKDRP